MLVSDEHLKELILKTGLITRERFIEIWEFAINSHIDLDDALIEKDIISDERLGILIADSLHVPFISLSRQSIPHEVLNLIPGKIARSQKVIPFAYDQDGVKLAMADPRNQELQNIIAKKTAFRVTPYLATDRDIENAMQLYRKDIRKSFDSLLEKEVGKIDISKSEDEAPIEKIVTLLIEFAYQDKASDIHIEPQEKDA